MRKGKDPAPDPDPDPDVKLWFLCIVIEQFSICIFSIKCNILPHVFWQAWFTARMAFTRTTAVMSIMGYMLGLGDRHLENINVDTTTGHPT
jgi:phosphatidylinositol kinase/protein kinase (PI-3  family)